MDHAVLSRRAFFAILEGRERDGNNVFALTGIDVQVAEIRHVSYRPGTATLRERVGELVEGFDVMAAALDVRKLQGGRCTGDRFGDMAGR